MKNSLLISIVFLTGALTFSILQYQGMSTTSGLVGYWKFDEGSGNTAVDSSGNGNTGTLYNGPAWVDGRFGKALSFDGVNDYVRIEPSPSLDVTSQITVEAWVYPRAYLDGAGHNPHIVSRTNIMGGAIYVLQIYAPSVPHKVGYAVNPYPWASHSTADLQLNVWTHLAMTYNGSYVSLYINGQFDSGYAQTGPIQTTNNWLAIGCAPVGSLGGPGTYSYFNGLIDEVKIYNRALSSNEIHADYIGTEQNQIPFWMQWWFWTIIVLGTIAVISAFTTVSYRKKAFAQREPKAKQANPLSKGYKVCPNCGANLPADSKYCGKCGISLE